MKLGRVALALMGLSLATQVSAATAVSTMAPVANPAAGLSLTDGARAGAATGKKSKLAAPGAIIGLVGLAAVAAVAVVVATKGGHSDSN